VGARTTTLDIDLRWALNTITVLNVSRSTLQRKRENNLIMTSYKKTYRVKGIPATFTKEDSRIFLTSILEELNENSELTVHSLGADPYSSERNIFQIATVTFQQVPRCLQDGKDQWTLPTTNSRVPNDTTVVSSITVDSHFSGFTPLNSVKHGSGHEIEYVLFRSSRMLGR
jgi:hypothetical protein